MVIFATCLHVNHFAEEPLTEYELCLFGNHRRWSFLGEDYHLLADFDCACVVIISGLGVSQCLRCSFTCKQTCNYVIVLFILAVVPPCGLCLRLSGRME